MCTKSNFGGKGGRCERLRSGVTFAATSVCPEPVCLRLVQRAAVGIMSLFTTFVELYELKHFGTENDIYQRHNAHILGGGGDAPKEIF